ncbi:Uncharacterized protein OBRU01_03366 [Operophtera brumata]|uniref:C2H2-type domain-containing protein n=1 Tax=Operophtera brumata TaxID=104452 RepID=A0A0L7LQV9_OPEBR|nr:Uncharacterized protein OBRU01_03366 [Operophtera brumata]
MDVDPLSSYEHYNAYQPPFPPQPNIPHPQPIPQTQPNIPHTQPIPQTQPNIPHTQPIPQTQPNIPNIPLSNQYPYKDYYQPNVLYNQNVPCAGQNNVQNATEVPLATEGQNPNARMTDDINTNQNTSTDQITMPIEEEDIKPDISKIKLKRVKKLKGKTSNYWNKKVTDKDFKFYGCSVCNISFQDLKELDAHVTMHSNRVTSYDIRVQNLKKRKQLMKQKKKKKRESKVKNEFELEIKPEDGYVGTEKAAEYNAQMDIMKNEDEKKFEDVAKEELADVKNDVKTIENGEMDKKKGNQKDEVYKCFACNKKFALSYYLKIHVRSHTDEKPYVCITCGQKFITASMLGRHNKRIHLAIRHQCRICYKFFNRTVFWLTDDIYYSVSDTGVGLRDEKPYVCNYCGQTFITASKLGRHNKRIHLAIRHQLQAETKKPKTEDPWGEWPLEAPLEAPGPTKVELEAPAVAKKMEPVEIKLEPEVLVEPGALPESEGFDETFERDPDSSDEDNVKEER